MFLSISKKGHISELIGYSGMFLGSEVEATGIISTEEDIFIDGKFKGSIKTHGVVECGKNSKIEASINARSVVIEGLAKSDIETTDSVQISSCAHVMGTIKAKSISVEPGSIIKIKALTE